MKTSIRAGALALAFSAVAMADDRLVRFEGGIGEIPVSNTTTPNTLRNVPPGGQPWVISALRADVRVDGSIKVDGRGLLLAGGNDIGTNGNQMVRARLSCEVLPAPLPPLPRVFTAHDSGPVPLDPDGDFRIDDELTPPPPAVCNNPALLILNGAGQRWFAAGIPKH